VCLVQYLYAEAQTDQPMLSCEDCTLKEDCDHEAKEETKECPGQKHGASSPQ